MPTLIRPRRFILVAIVAAVAVVSLAARSPAGAGTAPPSWVTESVATPPGFIDEGRVFTPAGTMADDSAIVVYGGQRPGSGSGMADMWRFDGTAWMPVCGTTTPATDPCAPGSRSGHGLATGPGGVVMFGGSADPSGLGTPEADTWTFDGDSWTQACTTVTCGPSPRLFPALAGNPNMTVLFGGNEESTSNDETWIWDGSSWTQICGGSLTPCGPGARMGASFAWDGTRFILFGGTDGFGGVTLDDSWAFDGTSWTQLCGTPGDECGPAPRHLAGLTRIPNPDPTLGGLVLYGGGDLFGEPPQTLYTDTWRWDGTSWSQLPTPWPSTPLVFSDPEGPAPGPAPLLPFVASRAADCTVVLAGTMLTGVSEEGPTFSGASYRAGWDLNGDSSPLGCTTPPPTTTTTSTSVALTTSTVPTPEPDDDVAPDQLAATGRRSIVPQIAFASALLIAGAALSASGRRRLTRTSG